MKALRFVPVAAAAALASLFLAAPAGASDNTGKVPVKPILTLPQCPRDGSIKLSKTADKSDYDLNDIVTFTLKVQASVCDAAVMVHDSLPAGLTVSDPSVLNRNFGAVAAGTEKSFSFQAAAVAKGQWTNKAHASGYSVGPDDPGNLCRIVRPPIDTPPNPVVNTVQTRIIVQPTYYCPKSSDAEVTIKVTAPSGGNPNPPPPPPTQPPSNSGTPSLPNTGRQG
jgi:uncharacterized repeat protein (TIGR01451 family)